MSKPKVVNGVPQCPCCGAQGIHESGMMWYCSVAPGYKFHADCDVEAERAKWDFKKIIRNGKMEIIHFPRTETVTTRLSQL